MFANQIGLIKVPPYATDFLLPSRHVFQLLSQQKIFHFPLLKSLQIYFTQFPEVSSAFIVPSLSYASALFHYVTVAKNKCCCVPPFLTPPTPLQNRET